MKGIKAPTISPSHYVPRRELQKRNCEPVTLYLSAAQTPVCIYLFTHKLIRHTRCSTLEEVVPNLRSHVGSPQTPQTHLSFAGHLRTLLRGFRTWAVHLSFSIPLTNGLSLSLSCLMMPVFLSFCPQCSHWNVIISIIFPSSVKFHTPSRRRHVHNHYTLGNNIIHTCPVCIPHHCADHWIRCTPSGGGGNVTHLFIPAVARNQALSIKAQTRDNLCTLYTNVHGVALVGTRCSHRTRSMESCVHYGTWCVLVCPSALLRSAFSMNMDTLERRRPPHEWGCPVRLVWPRISDRDRWFAYCTKGGNRCKAITLYLPWDYVWELCVDI